MMQTSYTNYDYYCTSQLATVQRQTFTLTMHTVQSLALFQILAIVLVKTIAFLTNIAYFFIIIFRVVVVHTATLLHFLVYLLLVIRIIFTCIDFTSIAPCSHWTVAVATEKSSLLYSLVTVLINQLQSAFLLQLSDCR